MFIQVPATYWDDYSDRAPVDAPEQMAAEVSRTRAGRVLIDATPEQLRYLLGDAKFYADGNTDDTSPAVLRGARAVCAKLSALDLQ